MKIVLDTNTLVSAIGWEGPPRQILLALREGYHALITTPDLLTELTSALTYAKLRPLATHPMLPAVLAWLHRPDHIVFPTERVAEIEVGPADNRVLEAAIAGGADAVVSGDQHLLRLRRFRGIPIMKARQFLDRFPRG